MEWREKPKKKGAEWILKEKDTGPEESQRRLNCPLTSDPSTRTEGGHLNPAGHSAFAPIPRTFSLNGKILILGMNRRWLRHLLSRFTGRTATAAAGDKMLYETRPDAPSPPPSSEAARQPSTSHLVDSAGGI